MTKKTEVAVGLVFDPRSGQVLVAQRPEGKPYPGWWEFAGGKIEPGESVHDALVRELQEELALDVRHSEPWIVREHVYAHAHVRLHFRRVTDWSGEPRSCEGQAFRWCDPRDIDVAPLLPAAIEPVRWLALPSRYLATDAARIGVDRQLEAARAQWARASAPAWVWLREPALPSTELQRLFDGLLELRAKQGSAATKLIVSSRHPREWWSRADGVHLTGDDLKQALARPDGAAWVLASCHAPEDLARAASIGVDAVTLSPVLPTRSHPDARPLGWDAAATVLEQTPLPVYLLGGLHDEDLAKARRIGAQGIAMQSGAWDQSMRGQSARDQSVRDRNQSDCT